MTFSIPNTLANGNLIDAGEHNQNYQAIADELNAVTKTSTIYNLIAPVGSIVAWLKSFPNTPPLPSGWVECNGQTLSDSESVYNGQVIPNLNGASGATKRFLRGSTTSGATGGSETHNHTIPLNYVAEGTGGVIACNSSPTGNASTLPSYYEVVWIMRVK